MTKDGAYQRGVVSAHREPGRIDIVGMGRRGTPWNTEAGTSTLQDGERIGVMTVLNWMVKAWRRRRGIEERDGIPVRAKHDEIA